MTAVPANSRTASTGWLPWWMAWLPVMLLPALVLVAGTNWPAWVWMWCLAMAIYASVKWLTLADCPLAATAPWARCLAYLFFWPGMDAATFLRDIGPVARPRPREWGWAVVKTVLGLLLVALAAWQAGVWTSLVVGWIGVTGVVLSLHFGLFHVLSCLWRRLGFEAAPIMELPVFATSLNDFWSRRWNRAFRDLANRYVFAPLRRPLGVPGAMLMVFLVSGVIHDVVISVPARGGWGLPTLYFLLQGMGLLAERSRLGKRWGLRRGIAGRLFAATVVLLPLPLLVHPAFIERVVVPMLSAWRLLL